MASEPRNPRAALAWAAALTPGLALFAFAATRSEIPRDGVHRLPFVLSEVLSVLGSALVVRIASARTGTRRWVARAGLAVLAIVVGMQLFMWSAFRTVIDPSALRAGRILGASMFGFLATQGRAIALYLGGPLVVALLLPPLLARLAPTAPAAARESARLALVFPLLAAVGFGYALPLDRALSPDVLFFASLVRLARTDPNAIPGVEHYAVLRLPHERAAIPVPRLTAHPARPRSVLLVLGESVRADETCIAPVPDCKVTPFTNAALPDRIPLLQMRAVDSATAISLGVLFTGLPPDARAEEFHSAPLLFEYAHAAGIRTAYWTSQNLAFGGAGEWLRDAPLDRRVSARELDRSAPLEQGADDALLFPRAWPELAALEEPFVAVLHLSNTHFRYRIDPREAPFSPETEEFGASNAAALRNRQEDALYHQDHLLADFLTLLRRSPRRDVIVIYLSDHGESFYEKGVQFHTMSLYDSELHVPAWIDAPPGTLTGEERARLEALENTPLTMIDVLPTILDLLGVADAASRVPGQVRLAGKSLIGVESGREDLVHLTNCASIWDCGVPNWGVIRGARKYIFREGDEAARCFDVGEDPGETRDLGAAGCAGMEGEFEAVKRRVEGF